MKEGTENVYKYHHKNERKEKYSLFPDVKGPFLREKIGKGKKILDIGCRDGGLTSFYCKENSVLGLDIDSEALSVAERDLGIETKWIDLNKSDWNLPEDYFDFAVAGDFLEHIYYPNQVTKKISKTLKEKGSFLGSVPNGFSLKNRIRLFFGKKENTTMNDPTHINHFSRKELKKILEEYFKEVKIYPYGKYSFLDKLWPGMFSFGLLFEAKNKKYHV